MGWHKSASILAYNYFNYTQQAANGELGIATGIKGRMVRVLYQRQETCTISSRDIIAAEATSSDLRE